MGSSSSNNNNNNSSRIAEAAAAVGNCISNNSNKINSNCPKTSKQTLKAELTKGNSLVQTIVVVVVFNTFQQRQQQSRAERTTHGYSRVEKKIRIEGKLHINSEQQQQQSEQHQQQQHQYENKQQLQVVQQQNQLQQQQQQLHNLTGIKAIHYNNNNNNICYHINLFIVNNTSSDLIIAVYVLVPMRQHMSICNNNNNTNTNNSNTTSMVTWRGEMKKSNRRRVSKRRAGNNVGNNNKALNMDDTSTITVGSGYNSNINSNSNNRNFGSQTGRAIISVATTIASTSASMAMANIPTNLLLPPSSSSSSSISTTSGSGNLMTTDIFDSHINSSNSNNNWSMDGVSWTTLNQSSATTEKVDLIEMDLANETFRQLDSMRGCRLYGFVGGLSGTASIGTLTAIALDRYNVVVHPLDPLRKTAKLRSAYIITIIWIYSFAFSIVPALDIGLSVYVPEGFLTTCSFDYLDKELGPRIFMFSFFIAAWCVPFGIICFSYFYILKVVFAANRIQSSKDKNKTEQKLALIVVGIIGLWFLAWTPYSIVAMMGVFGKQKYLTPLSSMIPALFCKTAACIDPYFYAATHPRFRMEFRRLWLGRGHLRRTSTTRSSYLTRSSTRRLRVISDADVRNRSSENMKKQNNLQALQEVTEENDEVYDFSIPANYSDGVEQSRF
ncbi:unnamed protein product [Ceratitis capitata]|uniref:(Mediterranean fruit fly) hypothetical protein n=1 Tax=Ceratitis capitata TaxID=7213 RepID=A0A811V862_CERCA|nr:unnamed protein product [Ceratitis capitata]